MPWEETIDSQILAIHAALLATDDGGEILYFGGDQHWRENNIDHEANLDKVDASRRFACRPGRDGKHAIAYYVRSPFHDTFCSGHAFLADGRLLVCGGTQLFPADAVGVPVAGCIQQLGTTWSCPMMTFQRFCLWATRSRRGSLFRPRGISGWAIRESDSSGEASNLCRWSTQRSTLGRRTFSRLT
jgi:hypothetical protein